MESSLAAVELKIFNFESSRKSFFGRKLKIVNKITSLAQNFAGDERNDEEENGLYFFASRREKAVEALSFAEALGL